MDAGLVWLGFMIVR